MKVLLREANFHLDRFLELPHQENRLFFGNAAQSHAGFLIEELHHANSLANSNRFEPAQPGSCALKKVFVIKPLG